MPNLHSKKLSYIAIAALAGLLVGTLLGYGSFLKYKSLSILSFDMKTVDYRKFQESVSDFASLDRYVSLLSKDNNKSELVKDFKNYVSSRQAKWVEPIQRMSKQDAKDFGEVAKATDDNYLIGLKFTATHRDPERAQQLTALQADYAMDAALRSSINEAIRSQYTTKRTQLERAEAEKVRFEYEIATSISRLKEFRRIAQTYPETSRVDARQLMSVDKGGERYLPIPSQMAALETQVVDMREQITRSERDLKKHPLELALLKEQIDALDKSLSGKEAINALISLSQQKLTTTTEEWAKLAYLENLNSLVDLRVKYVDRPSFLVQPSLPLSSEQPKPLIVAILLALLAAAAMAAWLFREQLMRMLRGDEDLMTLPTAKSQN
jgi:hypothetical protein